MVQLDTPVREGGRELYNGCSRADPARCLWLPYSARHTAKTRTHVALDRCAPRTVLILREAAMGSIPITRSIPLPQLAGVAVAVRPSS